MKSHTESEADAQLIACTDTGDAYVGIANMRTTHAY